MCRCSALYSVLCDLCCERVNTLEPTANSRKDNLVSKLYNSVAAFMLNTHIQGCHTFEETKFNNRGKNVWVENDITQIYTGTWLWMSDKQSCM